jgi:hypothetical protein
VPIKTEYQNNENVFIKQVQYTYKNITGHFPVNMKYNTNICKIQMYHKIPYYNALQFFNPVYPVLIIRQVEVPVIFE